MRELNRCRRVCVRLGWSAIVELRAAFCSRRNISRSPSPYYRMQWCSCTSRLDKKARAEVARVWAHGGYDVGGVLMENISLITQRLRFDPKSSQSRNNESHRAPENDM